MWGKGGSRSLGKIFSFRGHWIWVGLCSRLSSCLVVYETMFPLCTSGNRVGTLTLRLLECPCCVLGALLSLLRAWLRIRISWTRKTVRAAVGSA